MPNVMAALPNTGAALCSTPQSLADARYLTAVQSVPVQRKTTSLYPLQEPSTFSPPICAPLVRVPKF